MDDLTKPQTGAQNDDGAIDYIYGAANIAQFLKVSVRKVYYFMERNKEGKSGAPILNRPGFGLCASKKALVDYLNGARQV